MQGPSEALCNRTDLQAPKPALACLSGAGKTGQPLVKEWN